MDKATYDSWDHRNEVAKAAATAAIELRRQASFEPDYRHKQSDAAVIGMLVANHLEWDGNAIAEAFTEALTDANFHPEAAAIRRMFKLED